MGYVGRKTIGMVWSAAARNACRGENDEQQISQIAQIFKGDTLFYSSLPALGIGAASFASAVYGASKDIAESPTAIAGTPKGNS